MNYVIVDCGGFKQIISVEKTSTIRDIQDRFRGASIEGDSSGHAKIYTGQQIAQLFNGRTEHKNNDQAVLSTNVKPVNRK